MGFWNRIFGKNVAEQPSEASSEYDVTNDHSELMFMRIDRKNHVEKSRQNNREMINFHVTPEKLHEIQIVCGELDSARSDFIRAAVELALPIFKHHPEVFEQFKNKSKEGW